VSPLRSRALRKGGILALDVALRTGWAFSTPGQPALHGVWRLDSVRGSIGAACAALGERLADAITDHQPALLVFEQPITPPRRSASSARLLLSLCGQVETTAYLRDLQVQEVHPRTWKAKILGSPNAGKGEALAWARAQGYLPEDDNAADSLALLHYAHNMRAAA
jgi:Holliday junction resolvasome RuvABC endonuclease subunit